MKRDLLHNKYVLYVVSFLVATNLVGYLSIGDYESIIMMIATAILVSYFNKNIIVVLGASVLVAAVLKTTRKHEGFENKKKGKKDKKKNKKDKNNGVNNLKELNKNLEKEAKKHVDYEAATEEEEDLVKSGTKEDHLSSMEEQINHLSKFLDSGKVKNMSNNTDHLIKKQNDLVKQMHSLAPMLQSAENLIDKFEKSGMMNMVEKFSPIVEKILPMHVKK